MFFASSGCQALDRSIAHTASATLAHYAPDQPPAAKKTLLKPWREVMWCIGKQTEEYRNTAGGCMMCLMCTRNLTGSESP